MNENDNELKKNWRLIQPKKNSIKENNKENGLAISFYGGRKRSYRHLSMYPLPIAIAIEPMCLRLSMHRPIIPTISFH